MAKFGKWLGAGVGWSVLGPLGGVLGFFVGSWFDSQEFNPDGNTRTQRGDFTMSLLVLIAAVMKADGKVLKSELSYVQENLKRNFGVQAAKEASVLLRDLLNQEVPVRDVCQQIARRMDYSSRLQMLHFLYGISASDGVFDTDELRVIESIASYMQISASDRMSIKSMFVKDTDTAYKTLGVTKNSTVDEIKKAYREMAKKYHPDKVSYLGDDIKKSAEEKFRKINDAYEQIKKEKGIA